MMTVGRLREWLKGAADHDLIAVDEGGLTLEVKTGPTYELLPSPYASYEIGGWPGADNDIDQGWCRYCGLPINADDRGNWIDPTGGDTCGAVGPNENKPHVPAEE